MQIIIRTAQPPRAPQIYQNSGITETELKLHVYVMQIVLFNAKAAPTCENMQQMLCNFPCLHVNR